MYIPPLADEESLFTLPYLETIKAFQQSGASCTFYATYLAIILYYLSRGLAVPHSVPAFDWKEYYTRRNKIVNNELSVSTSFEESVGYYFNKNMLPSPKLIPMNKSKEAISSIMQRDTIGMFLVLKTYASFGESYTYNPEGKLNETWHDVYSVGRDKNYLYVMNSWGDKSHTLEGTKRVASRGMFRIPWSNFRDEFIWGQFIPTVKNENNWNELEPDDKLRYAQILVNKVDDKSTTIDNEIANMFKEYIKTDSLTKPIYDAYVNEVKSGIFKNSAFVPKEV